MKVFRWILSHLLLLVLVWTAVYIYLDWDNFRQQLPVAVTDWIDGLSSQSGTVVMTPESQPVLEAAPTAEVVPPVQAVEEVAQPVASVDSELNTVEQSAETVTEAPAAPVVVEATQEAPAAVEAPVITETPTVEKELPHPDVGSKPAESHELVEAERDLLIQAREAFWRRDLARAEKLYAELANAQPGNPDLWGELGNLYFAQNKVQQAADAYYKAAEILIEEGRFRQVESLMGVIGNVDQEKARELFQRMQNLYQQQQQPMYMR